MFNRSQVHVKYKSKIREQTLQKKENILEKYNNLQNRETHPKRMFPPK